MTFTETPLPGAFIIDIAVLRDDRGFFARTWSADELRKRGLDATVVQCNVAWDPGKPLGYGAFFSIFLLFFLPIIGILIIDFGGAKYLGPAAAPGTGGAPSTAPAV